MEGFYLGCVPSADIGSRFDVGARKLQNRAKIVVSVGKSSAQVVFLPQPKTDDKRPYDTRILCPWVIQAWFEAHAGNLFIRMLRDQRQRNSVSWLSALP